MLRASPAHATTLATPSPQPRYTRVAGSGVDGDGRVPQRATAVIHKGDGGRGRLRAAHARHERSGRGGLSRRAIRGGRRGGRFLLQACRYAARRAGGRRPPRRPGGPVSSDAHAHAPPCELRPSHARI